MTRFTSPSEISTWLDCQALWGRTYLLGQRQAEVDWVVIAAAGDDWQSVATPKQRSASLGQAAHDVLEAWFRNRGLITPKAWESFPAKVVHAGLHLLPHPKECSEVRPEAEFTLAAADVPGLGEFSGLGFKGVRDLQARVSQKELARLGIVSPSGWVLIDYKTSANIAPTDAPKNAGYRKTAAELHADPQGTIYPLYGMVQEDLPELPSRWVYFETKRVRRADKTDFLPTIESATAGARRLLTVVREIDSHHQAKTSLDRLARNPEACNKFGGCPHHASRGGDCPGGQAPVGAARWMMAWSKSTRPKQEEPAMNFAERQRQLKAEREAKAQTAPEPEVEETTEEEAPEAEEQAEPEPEPEPVKPPPRKPAATKPPAKAVPAPAKAKPPAPKPVEVLVGDQSEVETGSEPVKVELTITSGPYLVRMPVPAAIREQAEGIISALRSEVGG